MQVNLTVQHRDDGGQYDDLTELGHEEYEGRADDVSQNFSSAQAHADSYLPVKPLLFLLFIILSIIYYFLINYCNCTVIIFMEKSYFDCDFILVIFILGNGCARSRDCSCRDSGRGLLSILARARASRPDLRGQTAEGVPSVPVH